MSRPNSSKVRYDPLRSVSYTEIASADYVAVGGSLTNPAVMIKVNNTTDANLIISFDGVTDQDFIMANTGQVLDYCSNKSNLAGYGEQPNGDQLWVRPESTNPSTGNVYFTVIYLSQV